MRQQFVFTLLNEQGLQVRQINTVLHHVELNRNMNLFIEPHHIL